MVKKSWNSSLHLLYGISPALLVVTLHLRPLRSTGRAGVEPRYTRAAGRYAAAQTRNKRWFYVISLLKYWWHSVYDRDDNCFLLCFRLYHYCQCFRYVKHVLCDPTNLLFPVTFINIFHFPQYIVHTVPLSFLLKLAIIIGATKRL